MDNPVRLLARKWLAEFDDPLMGWLGPAAGVFVIVTAPLWVPLWALLVLVRAAMRQLGK